MINPQLPNGTPDPQNSVDLARIFIHGTVAILGGIANAIHCNSRNWKSFIGNMLVSSFTGFMFGLVALHFLGEHEYLTTAIAGTGGYMGSEGMNLLSRSLLRYVKVSVEECEVTFKK